MFIVVKLLIFPLLLKNPGESYSRTLANILEKHIMIVAMPRNMDRQYLTKMPASKNSAPLLFWSVNMAEESINL